MFHFSLPCEDKYGNLPYIDDADSLNKLSKPQNIGLCPHWDSIPKNDKNRENRIQSFLITSNTDSNVDDNSRWSRSTIFIPNSHLHKNLFFT